MMRRRPRSTRPYTLFPSRTLFRSPRRCAKARPKARGALPAARVAAANLRIDARYFAISFIAIAVRASVAVDTTAGASGAQKGEWRLGSVRPSVFAAAIPAAGTPPKNGIAASRERVGQYG